MLELSLRASPSLQREDPDMRLRPGLLSFQVRERIMPPEILIGSPSVCVWKSWLLSCMAWAQRFSMLLPSNFFCWQQSICLIPPSAISSCSEAVIRVHREHDGCLSDRTGFDWFMFLGFTTLKPILKDGIYTSVATFSVS